MTRDQWIAIFDKYNPLFIQALQTINPKDHCALVTFLHEQKDLLVEETVRVQRSNIRKEIDQQELPLENDFFKDSSGSVGSDGTSRKN